MNNYSEQNLRSFGLILAGLFVGIFGIIFPLLGHKSSPYWPWILATAILLPSVFKPALLKGLYTFWMKLGNIMGWINTRIILSIIFYGLVTPIGLLMRLCGYNALTPKLDKSATSYFHQAIPRERDHMEKPF